MTSSKNILITGGSGLVGGHLTALLQKKGYAVRWIGRSGKSIQGVKGFKWDHKSDQFDIDALHEVDTIIHLAGAGVGDKRWTKKRKQELYDSRIQTTKLLAKTLSTTVHSVKQVIAASAIGIYPQNESDLKIEDSTYGNDFLGNLTIDWEKELDLIESETTRLVKLRIGVVLSMAGGALPKLVRPVQLFVGAPLGSGKQQLSWIHIADLCQMFIYAAENKEVKGAHNAVSSSIVSNTEITKAIATHIKRPLFLPPIPGFVLKILLGEMATIALGGCSVSSEKIEQSGFKFQFKTINEALNDLLIK